VPTFTLSTRRQGIFGEALSKTMEMLKTYLTYSVLGVEETAHILNREFPKRRASVL